jgi:hypothetical protein
MAEQRRESSVRSAGAEGALGRTRVPSVRRGAQPPGVGCSAGLVVDRMREPGLAAARPPAFGRTTLPGQGSVAASDPSDRDVTAPAPGCAR